MNFKRVIYIYIEKLLSLYTDKIVCISKAEERSALKAHICKKNKLHLIPNGINIEAVRNAVPIERSSLNIKDDAIIIGMIGRLSHQKSPDIFIKSANIIHKYIPKSTFIIVGNGDLTEGIQQYAIDKGLPLIITGWTDNPYSYLKLFDIGLLLSRWEGFGLAIVEYMAAEKNVIASNIDAIPTLIDDGIDGILVEVDNPEDVANKVIWLYNHPKEAEEMRKKGLKKVIEEYDISRVVKQHMDLFNELLKMK